jgi:hypothetical protein
VSLLPNVVKLSDDVVTVSTPGVGDGDGEGVGVGVGVAVGFGVGVGDDVACTEGDGEGVGVAVGAEDGEADGADELLGCSVPAGGLGDELPPPPHPTASAVTATIPESRTKSRRTAIWTPHT